MCVQDIINKLGSLFYRIKRIIKDTFINFDNINDYGTYSIEYNNLIMKWPNNETKTFYSNNYILENKSYLENLKIIKPNKIIHDNKVLFSNISLCKNKII